jgi:flagellar hook-associated protein 2
MSAITSTGLGSGLDINGMVTKLIAAEGQAPTARLTATGTQLQTSLSALGVLQSALASFQTTVQALKNIPTFQGHTATSSNTASFTATADNTAIPVNFPVVVDTLAQSDIKRSAAFASDTALVGVDTLAISLGAKTFNITTTAGTTLTGLRDAINQATDNPGIQASIIKVSNTDSRLVLSSSLQGAANTLGVTSTISQFASPPASPPAPTPDPALYMTSVQAAADAKFSVGGLSVTRSSNTISDAIPGVTLSLINPDPAGGTLTVAQDKSVAQTSVTNFITAYNALNSTISSVSSYNATTKTAGPLFSDSALHTVQNQIRQALSSFVQGGVTGFSSLVDIGISKDKAGVLSLDSTKFNNAITTNFAAVSTLFTSSNGIAVNLDKVLTSALSSGGTISARVTGVNNKIAAVAKQQADLTVKLAASQARYLKQFNAMDTIMGQFQSTSSFLTQQFYSTSKN